MFISHFGLAWPQHTQALIIAGKIQKAFALPGIPFSDETKLASIVAP
jgi:hypothetical protein